MKLTLNISITAIALLLVGCKTLPSKGDYSAIYSDGTTVNEVARTSFTSTIRIEFGSSFNNQTKKMQFPMFAACPLAQKREMNFIAVLTPMAIMKGLNEITIGLSNDKNESVDKNWKDFRSSYGAQMAIIRPLDFACNNLKEQFPIITK